MTRFDPKAIIIAMLLSLTLDVVGSFFLVTLFGVQIDSGMSEADVIAAVRAVTETPGFIWAALLFGTATTVFAGHVAARVARSYPYFNALAVGVLGIVLGIVLADDAPFWFSALAYLLSIPAALAGAHLAQKSKP